MMVGIVRWLVVGIGLFPVAVFAQQAQPPSLPTQSAPTITIPLQTPSTIAGSGSWTSACLNMGYYRAFSVFGALSAAGTLQTQRYGDAKCTLPVGPAVPSTALALTTGAGCPSASRCGSVGSNDGQPFVGLTVTLTDTSASTNTVVSSAFLPAAE